jgi:hypothetical protein
LVSYRMCHMRRKQRSTIPQYSMAGKHTILTSLKPDESEIDGRYSAVKGSRRTVPLSRSTNGWDSGT